MVQVTVLPDVTVSVAGTNPKLSMLTSVPATGAVEPVADAVVAPGASGIAGMPLMPGIPGVVLAFWPKFTAGWRSGGTVTLVGRAASGGLVGSVGWAPQRRRIRVTGIRWRSSTTACGCISGFR